MIDWSSCLAVERTPGRVSGAWVFRGTRVPVAALFENLENDASVHEFVEWFPGVSLQRAREVLEHAARSALAVAWARILFDQGTPVPLRKALLGHEVEIAYERGWSNLQNGELIAAAAAAGFSVFVTMDRHLKHQQNLVGRTLAIVALSTTSWPRIRESLGIVVFPLSTACRKVAT